MVTIKDLLKFKIEIVKYSSQRTVEYSFIFKSMEFVLCKNTPNTRYMDKYGEYACGVYFIDLYILIGRKV